MIIYNVEHSDSRPIVLAINIVIVFSLYSHKKALMLSVVIFRWKISMPKWDMMASRVFINFTQAAVVVWSNCGVGSVIYRL